MLHHRQTTVKFIWRAQRKWKHIGHVYSSKNRGPKQYNISTQRHLQIDLDIILGDRKNLCREGERTKKRKFKQ